MTPDRYPSLSAINTAIVGVPCPRCRHRVYVPIDSDRESISCLSCDATLVTRRHVDSVGVEVAP